VNRADRRKQGQRGKKLAFTEPRFNARDVKLRDMRFETSDASENFLNLCYLDDNFRGTRDSSVRLPSSEESVSVTPSSGGMVYKAFPHGLMYGDQLALIRGMGLMIGIGLAVPFLLKWIFGGPNMYTQIFKNASAGGFVNILPLVLLLPAAIIFGPFAAMIFFGELIGYRFGKSALFDRNRGEVHLFSDQATLLKPWKCTVKSYDWRCIRAEIDTMSVFSGTSSLTEAGLRCVVMDRPNGKEVIDEFVLGINVPANCIQPLLDTWEHVRRFMCKEGPLFVDQNDKPNPGLGRRSLWQHLLRWPKIEIATTIDLFRIGWEDKSPLTLFMATSGVIVIPFVWILAIFGVLPWISERAKREPVWPTEIIASVGGRALKGKNLDAWRSIVPEKLQHDLTPPAIKIGE